MAEVDQLLWRRPVPAPVPLHRDDLLDQVVEHLDRRHCRRTLVRRSVAGVSAAAAVFAVGLGFALAPARTPGTKGARTPHPGAVTLSAARDLTDNQSVRVVASGLVAGERVIVVTCSGDPRRYVVIEQQCDTASAVTATADGRGSLRVDARLVEHVRIDGGVVDCAAVPERCSIWVGTPGMGDRRSSGTAVPVSFGPSSGPSSASSGASTDGGPGTVSSEQHSGVSFA